jgi:hypothetical protein
MVPIVASVLVVILILMLGLVANRLGELEERLVFRPATGLDPGALLPKDLAARGRAAYVPVYSHIYARRGEAEPLEVTLSVRNTDPEHPIRVDRVRYFDTDGLTLRDFIEQPLVLGPFQTASFLVEKGDRSGGSGANFLVEWSAQEEINPPILEAVMVAVETGISFTSRGVPIERH